MIDLYSFPTPNGHKVSIMLEEIALPYKVFSIDILKDEQFDEAFLKISPNNKIPAIVDHDNNGLSLMESGAILAYLAQKSGQLMPEFGSDAYWKTLQWLMFQMGGIGPMLGQAHHFIEFFPDASEYAKKRYGNEAQRLYGVLDKQLADNAFIAGEYSIADIATWPWISSFARQRIDLDEYPNVRRWYKEIAARPAVQKGYAVLSDDTVPQA